MHWRILHDGDEDSCILTFDFGPGRPGAGFDDLSLLLPGHGLILESKPPCRLSDVAASSDRRAYLEGLLHEVGQAGARVTTIFGYCAGSALAAAAAVLLASAGTVPRVVLFDPEIVQPATLLDAYAGAVAAFDVTAIDHAPAHSSDIPNGTPSALYKLADSLLRRYQQVTREVTGRLELPAKYAAQLVARFDSYLAYLFLCASCDKRGAGPPAAVIGSADHVASCSNMAEYYRFGLARQELLADRSVGELLGPVAKSVTAIR